MPATGAKRGNLVYHWRHGWIPRDHFAALSKAHHSKTGAVKVMQKHGIDVPKGYGSDHKAAPEHPAARTHPIGTTVAARQPGISNETHGRVVGHDSNGMLKVGYNDRKGNPVVGTFNPSHTRVIASGATTAEPHPAPHTLKPGEHATVRGIDHMGQPTTFTGKVTSNGEVSSFAKGRTTGGHPLRSISVERQDGSRRSNVVYVPDPHRGEQKRGTAAEHAAHAKVRDLPAADTFKGVHSETHMGERVTVRKGKEWGTIQTEINGHVIGIGHGTKNADAVKHLDATKGTVEHAKANPGNYTNGAGEANYGMKLGAKAPAAPKASPTPTHSAGMDPHAIRATQLREAATKKRAEADRIAGNVGAPDRAGAMLRAKDSARMNARMDSGLRKFTEKQREAKALEHKAGLAEARSKEATRTKLTHEDVKGATHVKDQFGWHEVVRVNAKTVTVKTPYSWTDSIPHNKVHQVLRATPEQIAAAKAKAARKK